MTGGSVQVPGYVLDVPIGSGGSGQVWRAHPAAGGSAVAIKLLPAVGPEQLAAARTEAAMLAGLDHPHLVRLHEAVPFAGRLALVLELAAAGSLADLLERRGRLAPGEVVTAVAPVGAALAYAHNADVVHGDVSAANIVFTAVGLPLLADLGVARLAGDARPARSTPAYLDPVVAAGGQPQPASDVFMLAAVALHALTGEPPWRSGAADRALQEAARGDLAAVHARLSAAPAPAPMVAVLAAALEPDPVRRPTAAEFALDLRHAAEPVAVDLNAGRGPRHACPSADARADARADQAAADPAFTRLVARARQPAAPRADAGRRERRGHLPRAALAGVAAVAAAGAVVALALALWLPGHAPAKSPMAARSAPLPAGPPPGGPRHRTAPAPHTMAPVPLDVAGAAQVLATLDVVRAQAFARRQPSLLAQVYRPGPLRDQDVATLTRLVPRGCGLYGVRTDYTGVRITARGTGRVVLSLKATLSPSVLKCAGSARARAPGSGPTALRVVLQAVDGRYLLAGITR